MSSPSRGQINWRESSLGVLASLYDFFQSVFSHFLAATRLFSYFSVLQRAGFYFYSCMHKVICIDTSMSSKLRVCVCMSTTSALSTPYFHRAAIPGQRGASPEPGDLPSAPSSCSCFDFQYVLPSPQMAAEETFPRLMVLARPLGSQG